METRELDAAERPGSRRLDAWRRRYSTIPSPLAAALVPGCRGRAASELEAG